MSSILISNRFQISLDDEASFIGQGGMGTVYKGLDVQSQEAVAVKTMKADAVARDPDMLSRFIRESELLRQLNHPNIVKMLGADEHDGVHYLVMEYVKGGSLRDVLDKSARFEARPAMEIALDVADALTRAHRLKILHRDIKPDNVLLAEDGTPRLTDFGLAHMQGDANITHDGAIMGTFAYMPPEVFMGEIPDERSDIWAFGVMLYEMLIGKRPFEATQPSILVNSIMHKPIPDIEEELPDLQTSIVDLIYRMLTKEPDARIPSVRLVGAELEAILRGHHDASPIQSVVSLSESTGRFQLDSSLPVAAPVSVVRVPNNLPNQPTPFVGRSRELDDLQSLLDGGSNLITLVGPGGIGKTRIALALAEQHLTDYPDGVFFVATAALDNTEHVVPAIAEAIHFSSGEGRQDLLNYLREKKMIIIFDNFEHLLDAADIISDMIQAAPDVVIIVTSRERLRLRGEQVYDVDGMILPDARDENPESIITYPAVELFMQSARRVAGEFEIDSDETAHDVAEVIRLVGGMPLGIELAAAWLEALPLEEIVGEIERSLDFLETDLRDVPERHRSIRAVFEYSWNLMSEDEQAVFKKLSVFRGGFEREAAQNIANASLRTLATLVNKSLISRSGDGRYHIQKMLRQYAEDRFQEDTQVQDETLAAHWQYYTQFSAKLTQALNSPKEDAAIEAYDKELENIRAAWQRCLERGQFAELDKALDAALLFYLGRSMLRECYQLFEKLGDALEQSGTKDLPYWRTRTRQAWIGTRVGKYDEAMKFANESLEYFRANNYPVEAAHALNQMSYVYMMQGDYDKSVEAAQNAAKDITAKDDITAYYMAMGNLGYAHYLRGELKQAREIYETMDAAEDTRKYSAAGVGYIKNNLGEFIRDMGEIQRATQLFEEAFAIFEKTHRKREMGFTVLNIGGIYHLQGHFDKAREAFEKGHKLYKEIGDGWGLGHATAGLGNSAVADGDYEKARAYYQESIEIRRGMEDKRGIADSLMDLATVDSGLEQYEEAESLINEALTIREEIADKPGIGMAYTGRGLVRLSLGRYDEAREDIRTGLEIGAEIDHMLIRARGYVGLGELEYHAGNREKALEYYKIVLKEHNTDDAPLPMMLYALTGIAEICVAVGQDDEALQIVGLVLRYPHNFITMVEGRARTLYDQLVAKLGAEYVQTAMLDSKSLALQKVIATLLED